MKLDPKEQSSLFPEECLLREIARQPRLSIGIPKENADVETRLALTPEGVAIVTEEGHSVYVQRGAGEPMSYSDLQYSEAGAYMVGDATEVFGADLVLKIAPPTIDELNLMHDRSTILSMLQLSNLSAECIKLMKAVGVLVGASGALLLVFTSQTPKAGESNFWGNIIVFGAVASFAIYLTVFKNLVMRYSPITIMKWMFLFGTIVCFPFCYKPLMQTDFTLLSSGTFWRIGFMVIFATFFGYLLIPIGQKVLRPTTLSMYNYIQPIVASMVAVFIGIDTFGYEQALSGVLVFSGVYIVTQSKSRAQMEAEKNSK